MNDQSDEISDKLKNYLNEKNQVKAWPGKEKNQLLVLQFLATKFEAGKFYTEKEVNEILNSFHTFTDPALLRRELFIKHLLDRELDGSKYWKTAK